MNPPSFTVGHEMSLQIVGLLLEEPLLSNEDVARRFGADVDSPFFITDMSIARIILANPDDYHLSDGFQRLASHQARNVMLCVGLDVCHRLGERFGEQTSKDLERWRGIVSFLSENPMMSQHVDMAIRTRKILDEISDLAGDKPVESETIIVEYVGEDPNFLFGGSDVDRRLLERLIAGVCDDPSVIDLDDLISSMLGSTDTEDRRNGWNREQAQDAAQGYDG
jgi:hypothetical protein